MVRHVVMFKFKPETEMEHRMAFVQRLLRLTDEVEVIRALEVGQNITETPRASDLVLIVDLDDEEALKIYGDHPNHQPVKQMIAEICSETRVVDYVI
jgi:hypothetical protein